MGLPEEAPATMTSRTPNFFIVGAAKSGTTSVARYLAEHPQVYMSPIKEPSYFARDIIPSLEAENWARNQRGLQRYLNGPMLTPRGGCVLEWEPYLRLFATVNGEKAIGEASTAYLISPRAPSDIRSAIPHARIIIMLRSPIERAFSTYLMFCRNGRLRASFSDVLQCTGSCALSEWRRMILETRIVAPGVERFLTTFPGSQIRWYLYEDLSTDPLAVMRNMYGFLEVECDFHPDVSRRYNEHMLPRAPLLHRAIHTTSLSEIAHRVIPAKARPLLRRVFFHTGPAPSLTPADHAILADYFRNDVTELSRLLQRDLSHWLRPR